MADGAVAGVCQLGTRAEDDRRDGQGREPFVKDLELGEYDQAPGGVVEHRARPSCAEAGILAVGI